MRHAFCRCAFGAGLALLVSVHQAGAVAYSAIQSLTLGVALGSGGLSASSSSNSDGATVYAGGTSSSNIAAVSSQNATSNVTIGGNVAIGGQGDASFLQGPNSAPTNNLTVTGRTNYASGASFQSTPGVVYNPAGGQSQPVPLSGAAPAVTNVVSTVKGLTADFTNPTGTVNAGRRGYVAIDDTTALTSTLTLSSSNSSNYFFLYLAGGIGSGGSIQIGGSLLASHVIVVLGAASTINTSTYGSYFISGAGNVTVASGGVINGGFFMAGTSTTPEELYLTGGAQIVSNPWNGYILANAPEPATLAVLGSALLGLATLRRQSARTKEGKRQ